ncbi:MAG: carboxylating nicotinate-nucleotide diphosphorylase [Candidatus Heimdallarchaeota archaeon]|nr:carboxylating nicotinate-nucleotide diphosphorylase [Candidatus Heimdallarchaeota archaeon]
MTNFVNLDQDIISWLQEDIPYWDTNSDLILNNKHTTAKIQVKQNGVLSGTVPFIRVFSKLGVKVVSLKSDGDKLRTGEIVFNLEGPIRDILMGERVSLNILSHMSGISTMTANLMNQIKNEGLTSKIAATRKTLPGLRKYQKWAVKVGNGDTHRMSLSDMIMLKENHLSQFSSITEALEVTMRQKSFSQKIEIEVTTNEQALEAARGGVDIIMLDNYNSKEISGIISEIRKINQGILIEVSGNITEANFMDFARKGIDIISMGKLTHSSVALDFSLLVD